MRWLRQEGISAGVQFCNEQRDLWPTDRAAAAAGLPCRYPARAIIGLALTPHMAVSLGTGAEQYLCKGVKDALIQVTDALRHTVRDDDMIAELLSLSEALFPVEGACQDTASTISDEVPTEMEHPLDQQDPPRRRRERSIVFDDAFMEYAQDPFIA